MISAAVALGERGESGEPCELDEPECFDECSALGEPGEPCELDEFVEFAAEEPDAWEAFSGV